MEGIRPEHISEEEIKSARGEDGGISKPGRSGTPIGTSLEMELTQQVVEVGNRDPKTQLTESLIEELRNTPDEEMSEQYHRYMDFKAQQRAIQKEKDRISAKKKFVKQKAKKATKQSRKKNRK